jgi:hypothetical protein
MWTGKLPTKGAVYQIWTDDSLEALAASIVTARGGKNGA